MSKRAILYARVSTDEQAEKGYSLPTQLAACQKYAEQHGFSVAATFTDDYTGSVPIEYRPAGKQAYEMLKGEQADALIVYAVDRLVRPPEEGDEWDTPILIRGLAKLGKELHVCNRGKLGTGFGEMLLALLEARSAGDERRKIQERTMRGKAAKVQSGKWIGSGHAPFGFRKVGLNATSHLEIDPDKAEILRRIYAMYLGRDGYARHSFRQIARILTGEKVRPPQGGRGWYPGALKKMVMSQTCIGVITYCGHETHFPELAIIDRETFEAAQRQRKHNRETYSRKRLREYLLSSILYCPCGARMTGTNLGNAGYYRCCRQRTYDYLVDDCTERRGVRAGEADAAVWAWVAGQLADVRQLESGLAQMAALRASEHETQRARLAEADELLAHVDGKIRRLAASIAETDNATALEALRAELATQSKRKEELSAKRAALAAEAAQGEVTATDRARIKEFAALVRSRLKGAPTFAQKRELLELLDLRAELHSKDGERWLTVTCAIMPNEEARITASSLCRRGTALARGDSCC